MVIFGKWAVFLVKLDLHRFPTYPSDGPLWTGLKISVMKSSLSKSTKASRAETDINRMIKSFSFGTCNRNISRFLLFEISALNLSNLVKFISRDESLFAFYRFQKFSNKKN